MRTGQYLVQASRPFSKISQVDGYRGLPPGREEGREEALHLKVVCAHAPRHAFTLPSEVRLGTCTPRTSTEGRS
jgi:hypothetical protein